VLPGTYTVRLTVNGASSTRDFEVRTDPRRETSRRDLTARQDALMDAYALSKPIRDAGERLGAMSGRISDIQTALAEADISEDVKDELGDEAEAISKEIGEVRDAFGRANRMGRGTSGLENWSGAPSADQLWAIQTTWEEVVPVIERINTLLTDRFPAFEGRLTEAGLRPAIGDPIVIPRQP